MLAVTLVLARVLAEANGPAPVLSDDSILVLKRHDIRVGNGCMAGDAGVGDAGDASDGGSDGGADAGPADAGIDGPSDAGPSDAGDASDAGDGSVGDPCEHIPGDAITIVMQPHFSQLTTGARFAILMVTPSRPVLETTTRYVFSSLDEVTAPITQTIEKEIEDPTLGKQCPDDYGCGATYDYPDDPYWDPPTLGDGGLGDSDGGFSIDAIGPYQVLRANPTTAAELGTWLTDLGYLTMPADIAAVAPYIAKGYTVVALRVALDDTPDGQLAPIAITWAGSQIRLPAAVGSPTGTYPTTVYIAADHRYDLPGAAVPFAFRTGYADASFLTRNELAFASTGPDSDPVAIQISGDPTERPIIEHVVEVRVPVKECPPMCGGDGEIGCGCGQCSTQKRQRADWFVLLGAIAFTLRRRRRRR